MQLSLNRIKQLSWYYTKISFNDKSRLFLIIVWPIIDLLIWGFTTIYLTKTSQQSNSFIIMIVGTFILWNITIKAQQEISGQFMQDVFSKNFNNLLVTPLRESEIIISLILSSFVKIALVFLSLYIFALIFFSVKFADIKFLIIILSLINLFVFGWSLGIIATAFIVRFGHRANFLTWSLAFLAQPFSCVFYPRIILPKLLYLISLLSPISYIFEILRNIFFNETSGLPIVQSLIIASILNFIFILISYIFFKKMLFVAKMKCKLIHL